MQSNIFELLALTTIVVFIATSSALTTSNDHHRHVQRSPSSSSSTSASNNNNNNNNDEDLDLDYGSWFPSNNQTKWNNGNNSSRVASGGSSSEQQRHKMIGMIVRNQLKKELRKLKSSMTDAILEEVINYYGKRLDGADALKSEVATLSKRVALLSHNLNTLGQNFKTISKSHRNLVDLVRNNIAMAAKSSSTTTTTTTTSTTTTSTTPAAANRLNSSNLKKKSIESAALGNSSSSEASKLKQELLNDLETKYSNLLNERLVEIIIRNFKANESLAGAAAAASSAMGLSSRQSANDVETSEGTKLTEFKSSDCQDLRNQGFIKDGVYRVTLDDNKSINVFCEFRDNIGWTVLQRRFDGSVDFYQNWQAYKNGFGNMLGDGEFWLGLENMHELTHLHNYSLQIIMTDWKNEEYAAEYALFRVNDEAHKYRLELGAYLSNTSSAGDSLGGGNGDNNENNNNNNNADGSEDTAVVASGSENAAVRSSSSSHNHMSFSTFDSDNDMRFYDNCAQIFKSGWWFNACFQANLNGLYYKYSSAQSPAGGSQSLASASGRNVRLVRKEEHAQLKFLRNGIHWNSIDFYKSLKSTKLRIRRVL